MTVGQIVNVLGGFAQLGGIVAASIGATKTWNEFSPNERILDPTRNRVAAAYGRLEVKVRRVLGLQQRPLDVRIGTVCTSVAVASAFQVRTQFNELDLELPIEEALRQLDIRSRDMLDRLYSERDQLVAQLGTLRTKIENVETDHTARAERLADQTRHIAIGGIRLALIGLSVTGFGVVLQTIGTLLP